MGLVWLTAYTLVLHAVRATARRPRVRKAIETITGVVLVALGARLALERQ